MKRLVAELIDISYESIGRFVITNPEMPPEALGDKFCRLDINMMVGDRRVNLEIQVKDEYDFPERPLFQLFDAETEEEIREIEALEAPIMNQAIGAYRSIRATEEFRTLERMRSDARHNEATALDYARREESEKWQKVVEKKEAALADKDAEIARLRELLGRDK